MRKFEDKDLGLFKQWLYKEHVAKWYIEPNAWINEIKNRSEEFSWLHHFIVEVEGIAIGFFQYYDYALGGETWHNRIDVKKIIVQLERDNHASRNTLFSAGFLCDVENDVYYKELIS